MGAKGIDVQGGVMGTKHVDAAPQASVAAALAVALKAAAIGLIAITLSFALASESVPVAWQRVHDGWPVHWSTIYYDSAAGRVRDIQPNHRGNPPLVWQFDDNDAWVRLDPEGQAPEETVRCSAYDTHRNALVVIDDTGSTHELTDDRWTSVSTSARPAVDFHCSMVYDAARSVIVLLALETSNAPNVTWEYDGAEWTQIAPSLPPPVGPNPELTYDSDRGIVLAYGEPFDESAPVFRAFVYEYTGLAWTPITPLGAATPGRRRGHAWVYDPDRGNTLLVSGYQDLVGKMADLWEWDGTRWTRLEEETPPGALPYGSAVHDAVGHRVVQYGGEASVPADRLKAWSLSGSVWTLLSSWEGPTGYALYGMTMVPGHELLVFGGADTGASASDETWLWDGTRWSNAGLVPAPSATNAFSLAYDPGENAVIGFGGHVPPNHTASPDTHRHDWGSTGWTSTTLPGPRARKRFGIAYAPWLEGTVMFGGTIFDDLGVELSNTLWRFRNGSWAELPTSALRPSPRDYCDLASDNVHELLWTYGGAASTGEQKDLWHFDGENWTLVQEDSPPGTRATHGIAYDPIRDRVVVFGDGPSEEDVTWEWGNGAWHARTTATKPESDRRSFRLVYDPSREVIFLYGGKTTDQAARYDLWAYGADPDEDGIVGKLDNCQLAANPTQSDGDDDARGDACDCAATDPDTWALPPEAAELHIDASGESLSWQELGTAAGTATVYDLLRGNVHDLPLAAGSPALCLGRGLVSPSATDTERPAAGEAWWYLARGRNDCGAGSYGAASAGQERVHDACDGAR